MEWIKEVEEARKTNEYVDYPTRDSSYRVKTICYLTPQKHYGWFHIVESRLRYTGTQYTTSTESFYYICNNEINTTNIPK